MAGEYPLLKDDLAYVKKIVDEPRSVLRAKADKNKSWYYWSQMIVLFGGVLLVAAGALQATLFEEEPLLTWFNAILGFILGLIVLLGRELKFQRRWLKQTAASEQMKQERFRFLGRVGDYTSENPKRVLETRLYEIEEQLEKPE